MNAEIALTTQKHAARCIWFRWSHRDEAVSLSRAHDTRRDPATMTRVRDIPQWLRRFVLSRVKHTSPHMPSVPLYKII